MTSATINSEVKRYLVFAWYAETRNSGGWEYYRKSFDDFTEAKKAISELSEEDDGLVPDFAHIVDLHTGEVIFRVRA